MTGGGGPYSFKINGKLHHLTGSLLPEGENEPMYAQLQVHDPALALGIHQRCNPGLEPTIMTQFWAMLQRTHPYVGLYRENFQIMNDQGENQQDVNSRWCIETYQLFASELFYLALYSAFPSG